MPHQNSPFKSFEFSSDDSSGLRTEKGLKWKPRLSESSNMRGRNIYNETAQSETLNENQWSHNISAMAFSESIVETKKSSLISRCKITVQHSATRIRRFSAPDLDGRAHCGINSTKNGNWCGYWKY